MFNMKSQSSIYRNYLHWDAKTALIHTGLSDIKLQLEEGSFIRLLPGLIDDFLLQARQRKLKKCVSGQTSDLLTHFRDFPFYFHYFYMLLVFPLLLLQKRLFLSISIWGQNWYVMFDTELQSTIYRNEMLIYLWFTPFIISYQYSTMNLTQVICRYLKLCKCQRTLPFSISSQSRPFRYEEG